MWAKVKTIFSVWHGVHPDSQQPPPPSGLPRITALKFLTPDTNPPVPWHRVIGSSGTISSRGPGTDGARRQRDALVAEGITVNETRDGEFKVDFRHFGWFPAVPNDSN